MRCGSAWPEPADDVSAPEPASTEGARSTFRQTAFRRTTTASGRLRMRRFALRSPQTATCGLAVSPSGHRKRRPADSLFRPPVTASGDLRATSLGVVASEQRRDRHQDDLQVEPERPVLDVVVVPLDPVVERGLPAQPLHLRPAGQTGLDAMAVAVAVDVLLEGADEVRALRARPDDRHVAAQDVEELRQLVERQAAHDLADARAAVVALDAAGGEARLRHELLGGGRRDPHRAELEHVELAAVETDAALAVEDRAGRAQAHGEREYAERKREDQQRQG